MRPLILETATNLSPEDLVSALLAESAPGIVLLRSGGPFSEQARYSFVAARPFLSFRSLGSRCELSAAGRERVQFGNPWHVLDSLMQRYEMIDSLELPFPLGGCFGYWGYDLKNFVEPKLPRVAVNDLEIPDAVVGFYDSIAAFDHHLGKSWIISTGLNVEGERDAGRAEAAARFWQSLLGRGWDDLQLPLSRAEWQPSGDFVSTLCRETFIDRVRAAQEYIRKGDIYQVNLAHRLEFQLSRNPWELFKRAAAVSPAPFSAFLDCGDFQIVSSSPERFLRLSGSHIQTRPIKGTRPRSADPDRDAQLTYELQTSAKETAELVMITDLLRNDLGRVCEFGTVRVPELLRLERYSHVQHLVSTIEGRLRDDVTHFSAFSACFPGGSITGAPKFRAMQIIDELEPVGRGPYTGALGYLGFNRESQVSIVIRAALCRDRKAWFHAGAGIVADSVPEAEYEETLVKTRGFVAALGSAASSLPVALERSTNRGPL